MLQLLPVRAVQLLPVRAVARAGAQASGKSRVDTKEEAVRGEKELLLLPTRPLRLVLRLFCPLRNLTQALPRVLPLGSRRRRPAAAAATAMRRSTAGRLQVVKRAAVRLGEEVGLQLQKMP